MDGKNMKVIHVRFFFLLRYLYLFHYMTRFVLCLFDLKLKIKYLPSTVGSSSKTSSPTCASNIAFLIAAVGFVSVSLRRSTIIA